jgi:dihydrodipicolinate synthase/N-acetylneuraminate lyase
MVNLAAIALSQTTSPYQDPEERDDRMPNLGEQGGIEYLRQRLREGLVIPAHPLALTADRKLDEKHQRALTRYYLAAGAGGVAVGVHTTQFQIHHPEVGLYRPVLELAIEEVRRFSEGVSTRPLSIAGIIGKTSQALQEAELARDLGYDCGLIGLGAMKAASDDQLIEHVQALSQIIPIFGFYLQPSVGGRVLSLEFWQRFAQVKNLVAIKIAPFNRYRTMDVVRAVAESGRAREIALYTGNDDNIVSDLLAEFRFSNSAPTLRIVGGLLGHWAVWTRRAVELLSEVHQDRGKSIPSELLTRGLQITDANAALFDPQHDFAGCIPGIHEVLRRQGLLAGRWCLNPDEELSPGQMQEIDRIHSDYPHLNDDFFVAERLDEWLS